MDVKVILVDINPKMAAAWRDSFEDNPEVEIVTGSMLERRVDAWVTPTNSSASMDGGLDGIIKSQLGDGVEKKVKRQLKELYGGELPVGHATCVRTGVAVPKFLISTPTMVGSSEDISDSLNVALAAAAAFQAVRMRNAEEPGSITSVALPGLGANTGKTPVEICADLMWTGYNLFREFDLADFAEMRSALEEQLGDLTPMTGKSPPPAANQPKAKATPKPAAGPAADEDFDDAE